MLDKHCLAPTGKKFLSDVLQNYLSLPTKGRIRLLKWNPLKMGTLETSFLCQTAAREMKKLGRMMEMLCLDCGVYISVNICQMAHLKWVCFIGCKAYFSKKVYF